MKTQTHRPRRQRVSGFYHADAMLAALSLGIVAATIVPIGRHGKIQWLYVLGIALAVLAVLFCIPQIFYAVRSGPPSPLEFLGALGAIAIVVGDLVGPAWLWQLGTVAFILNTSNMVWTMYKALREPCRPLAQGADTGGERDPGKGEPLK